MSPSANQARLAPADTPYKTQALHWDQNPYLQLAAHHLAESNPAHPTKFHKKMPQLQGPS